MTPSTWPSERPRVSRESRDRVATPSFRAGAAEGAKFLPTLLIIGAWLYVMRSVGGGGGSGGGGGMSNIFRIGQSKAKKIKKEDVNVTYADVRGPGRERELSLFDGTPGVGSRAITSVKKKASTF